MRLSRRLISTGLTHAAAVLVGWAGWVAWQRSVTEKEDSPAPIRGPHHVRTTRPGNVDKMLAGFAAEAAVESAATEQHDWPRMDDARRDEFARAIAATAVPVDFKTALREEMASMKSGENASFQVGALLYLWALEDPQALMVEWPGYEDGERAKALWFYKDEIIRKLIAERGLAALAPILQRDSATARVFARAADVVALGKLKQMRAGNYASVTEIGECWPWAERAKLVNFAVSESSVEMIASLATTAAAKASGAGAWLLQLLRDESLDSAFRGRLTDHDVLKQVAHDDRTLWLADRVALLSGENADAERVEKHHEDFAARDVAKIEDHQRDWSYEFRHGAVDAGEVLAAISKELPELAATSPTILRDRVFKNLVEEDPARAARLLDPLPPDERAKLLLEAAKNQFYQTDPNLLLATLRLVPAGDPHLHDDRQEAWDSNTGHNFQNHDAAYVDWVLALPGGIDREMALRSLKRTVEETDTGLAARLRGEMKSRSE